MEIVEVAMTRKACILAIVVSLVIALATVAQNNVQLPPETVGMDGIVEALISVFDHADILAIADTHQRKFDSDLRIQLVRHPVFARKVRLIVVEFANTADQAILDRYVSGEDMPATELQKVWRNTCCPRTWDSPVYADFFAAVKSVNRDLPVNRRIRVLAGDPPAGTSTTQRGPSAAAVVKNQVLDKGEKALVIYGCGHLSYATGDLTKPVQATYPGRMFVLWAAGGSDVESQRFESGLKSTMRPVLVPVTGPPFNTASSECGPLGQSFDGFIYLGLGADTFVRPAPLQDK